MMAAAWFCLLALFLTAYTVLDGWDLGVGAIHLVAGRTDEDRRINIAAIGPLWNGNEVWLIAGGGALFLSFPQVYATSFSGFYLALMLLLWLLIARGIALEFRSVIAHPLWAELWDTAFSVCSALIALLLGVALGNVVRGLPLAQDRLFQGSFTLLLNGYALLVGVLSLLLLSLHGANFLRVKTAGPLNVRVRTVSRWLSPVVSLLVILTTLVSIPVRPGLLANFGAHPALWIVPAILALTVAAAAYFSYSDKDSLAFYSGIGLIAALLAAAGISIFPDLVHSTLDPEYSLTVWNAAASPLAVRSGMLTIGAGLLLVIFYQAFVYRTFLGKVLPEHLRDGYGH